MVERFSFDGFPEVARVYSVTRRTVWQIADPYHILLYIRSGSCSVELDGAVLRLGEGSFLLIPEKSLYLRRPAGDQLCTMFYAHFHLPAAEISDAQAAEELTDIRCKMNEALLSEHSLYPLSKKLYVSRSGSSGAKHREICSLFEEAIAGIAENRLYGTFQASVLVSRILLMLSEETAEQLFLGRLTLDGAAPEKLRRAILYIRMHSSEKISLDDLSRACSVSRQQIIRYFHTYLGTTPTAYLIRYKMNRARELFLSAPQMSIKEVSAELGFDDQCYFSRIFSRITGETPTAYCTRIRTFDEEKHIREAQETGSRPEIPGQGGGEAKDAGGP